MKKIKTILLSIFLLIILTISTITVVDAASITVNPDTPKGIEQAIDSAKNGDTIYLENGVYKKKNSGFLYIDKNITIKGLGSKVILDGQGKDLFFTIEGKKVSVSLQNLIFKNGYSGYGGAIEHAGGSLTIINCTFTNNKAKRAGGAIYSDIGGKSLVVINCTFNNNQAVTNDGFGSEGGAIHSKVKITVEKCIFNNNKAIDGGAIFSLKNLTVINCTFTNNKAIGAGGAIDSCGTTVSDSTFTNNQVQKGYGGAIGSCCLSSVRGCTFTNNKAKVDGGAIYNSAKKYKIVNSNFKNNIAGKFYNSLNKKHIYATDESIISSGGDRTNVKYKTYIVKVTLKNVKMSPKDGTKVKK